MRWPGQGEPAVLWERAVADRGRSYHTVTRTALQNASSISGLILTTEALITDLPEKEAPAPAMPPGGGMGGMGGMY